MYLDLSLCERFLLLSHYLGCSASPHKFSERSPFPSPPVKRKKSHYKTGWNYIRCEIVIQLPYLGYRGSSSREVHLKMASKYLNINWTHKIQSIDTQTAHPVHINPRWASESILLWDALWRGQCAETLSFHPVVLAPRATSSRARVAWVPSPEGRAIWCNYQHSVHSVSESKLTWSPCWNPTTVFGNYLAHMYDLCGRFIASKCCFFAGGNHTVHIIIPNNDW